MFRELISYCVTAIASSGFYSLALQQTPTASFLILSFWSGNVFHRVCLGCAPRGMLLPRKILSFMSSFLSLFETESTCLSLVDLGDKLGDCLSTCLPGKQPPTVVKTLREVIVFSIFTISSLNSLYLLFISFFHFSRTL